MTTPPNSPVGVGIALRTSQVTLERLAQGIPIGLSTFTTNVVTVHYTIEGPNDTIASHALEILPGETIKLAAAQLPPETGPAVLRFRITDVEGGQVTGRSEVWHLGDTAVTELESLVPAGSWWFYLDDGSNQVQTWTRLDFDESGWSYGQAELGYGEASSSRPETTIIGYGPDSNAKHLTYYFRHRFVVEDPAAYGGLVLDLQRDDGAVVHINGQPILTNNITASPINYLTRANLADDDGAQFHSTEVAASLLQPGTNVVAVEVHQQSPTSSDVSFDLRLEAAPLPTLQLLSMNQEHFLFWSGPGFVLEQAPRLGDAWETLPTASPAPVSTDKQQSFYRLRATTP